MTKWQEDRLAGWQEENISVWARKAATVNGERPWKAYKLTSWEAHKLANWQFISCQNDKMIRGQVDRMTRRQHLSVSQESRYGQWGKALISHHDEKKKKFLCWLSDGEKVMIKWLTCTLMIRKFAPSSNAMSNISIWDQNQKPESRLQSFGENRAGMLHWAK